MKKKNLNAFFSIKLVIFVSIEIKVYRISNAI